jgi:hypothetical protein
VRPHAPQFDPSVAMFTHDMPQSVWPTGHTQRPPEHTGPTVHSLSHAPQWLLSDDVSVQATPHIIRGAVQPATPTQRPPVHTSVELQP